MSRSLFLPIVFVVLLGWPSLSVGASEDPRSLVPVLQATRAASSIVVDGLLDEEAWLLVEPAGGFLQRDPAEGEPASEATEVRIVYDDEAVYFGLRMYDSEPDSITRRMSRRDDRRADADSVTVYLDASHDHLTGNAFQVTAAGVQGDDYLYDDTRNDRAWEAVWQSEVSIDALGWVAELRIPYSQLRFGDDGDGIWGVNVERMIRRKNETSWLVLVPKDERGQVSRMAHMRGFEGIGRASHLELLPYVLTRGDFVEPSAESDPFNDGSRIFGGAGVDVKWGLTGNFTLDGAINPDFGQVELDPEVINLTAFETYFEERRPFFLEGAQIFRNFGGGGGAGGGQGFGRGRGGGTTPQLFYSRRIGRAPRGSADGEFVDTPPATTILGAAKITGKTAGGWSVGVLEAVTGREWARVADGAVRSRAEVEPLTSYAVARALREGGRGGVGLLGTVTVRQLRTDALSDLLPRQAIVGGVDAYRFFDQGREWLVSGQVSASQVRGSAAAIERLQRTSARYFQRPDLRAPALDPTRTSLGGWSTNVSVGRHSGSVRLNGSFYAVSPGFEVNDLGFQNRADRFGGDVSFSWHKFTPDGFTRQRDLRVSRSWSWNFDRDGQGTEWSVNGGLDFNNYWNLNLSLRRNGAHYDDQFTRGGPSARQPGSWGGFVRFGTDSRQMVSLRAGGNWGRGDEGAWRTGGDVDVEVKLADRLDLSVGPRLDREYTVAQYVTSVDDALAAATSGSRYVFADLTETQLSVPTRVNFLVSPTMSFQVYAQPLVAVGRYWGLKEFARPRSFAFIDYARAGWVDYDEADAVYTIDPDGPGPAGAMTIDNRDFNRKSLRLQAVFRWEWRPGSRLYVVWTERRRDDRDPGRLDALRDLGRVFSAPADDVLAVKLTFWFGR